MVGELRNGDLGLVHGEFDARRPLTEETPIVNGFHGSQIPAPPLVPVAVCGLAMRLPGNVRDSQTFWDLLTNGVDARRPIPPDRYDTEGFDARLGPRGAIETQSGYFLDEDLRKLDTSFFSMTRHELERMDPQQRQVLEVTQECLDNAGEVGYRGKRIGCYVGTFGEDWLHINTRESQPSGRSTLTGYSDLMIANRISYEFDLRGPRSVSPTPTPPEPCLQ